MDQEQSVLYQPLGELREVRAVVRNVMKPGDKKYFPHRFPRSRTHTLLRS